MSKLLSDDRILELAHRRASKYTHRTTPGEAAYGFTAQHLIDFVRYDIEAAVLDAQKQEPVAYLHPTVPKAISVTDLNDQPEWVREKWLVGTKLYAAPVVQPGMVMCDVCGKPTMHSGSRCYGCCQIAAAEGKK